MSKYRKIAVKYRLCAVVSLAITLLSLLPQIHLWAVRGTDWNGVYVSPQGDEAFYSGYVNALINGRARKNDPYGGIDDVANARLPESIFSIQFIPAYLIALPARALGVSASTAFIVLIAIAAFLASSSIFLLLRAVTNDEALASAGTLIVLCFGCIVGGNGIFGTFIDIGPAAFPFLRRYQPALPFSLFFIFQLLTWRALTSTRKKSAAVFALVAAISLVILIFSHLYLWTAAAVCLVSVGLMWLLFRRSDRRRAFAVLGIIGGLTPIALAPYIFMILNRARTLDEQQILISTHRPDLFRLYEIVAIVLLAVLAAGVRYKKFKVADPRVIYCAALSLLPIVVFNQQVITGKTMQVFHYEVAVVNYSTLIALVIALTLFISHFPQRLLVWAGAVSLLFAFVTTVLPARLVFVPQAVDNDRRIPVLLRLKQLAQSDGTLSDLRTTGATSALVFSPSVALITLLPTWTSQGTLLDTTGIDCRSLSRNERKRFFLMHLYYSKVDIDEFRRALSGNVEHVSDRLSSVRTVVFGYERTSPALTPRFEPIRTDEIEREVQNYEAYVNSFSHEEALKRPLAYAVIPVEGNFDFTNLDRWYERDAGERIGDYVLYRLRLR